MQHVLQGSQLALLCSIHHKNIILIFYMRWYFCVCVCVYCLYEYAGISMCVYECVYRAHVCIHTHRCIHVSIYVFIDPHVSISMYTHTRRAPQLLAAPHCSSAGWAVALAGRWPNTRAALLWQKQHIIILQINLQMLVVMYSTRKKKPKWSVSSSLVSCSWSLQHGLHLSGSMPWEH